MSSERSGRESNQSVSVQWEESISLSLDVCGCILVANQSKYVRCCLVERNCSISLSSYDLPLSMPNDPQLSIFCLVSPSSFIWLFLPSSSHLFQSQSMQTGRSLCQPLTLCSLYCPYDLFSWPRSTSLICILRFSESFAFSKLSFSKIFVFLCTHDSLQ